MRAVLSVAIACALAAGCGGGQQQSRRARHQRARGVSTTDATGAGLCDTTGSDREVSEYDTSGDTRPDVRRVFRRVGDPPITRLVLTCRESDLNGDGTKDVVRYYNEEGRPLREEADRDFDGQMDTIEVFQDGRVVRTELDSNADGRVDTKIFYDDDGTPIRTERDLAGRSTAETWRPDRWEYFENGRMVRMGTDLDGDGRVDRWDRDHEYSPPPGETEGDPAGPEGAATEG
jgi:YD repeat-containing protein